MSYLERGAIQRIDRMDVLDLISTSYSVIRMEPDGCRVPGTSLQVDPLEGTFNLGVLIRYLDHNDASGGAEWGHPSGMMLATLTVM